MLQRTELTIIILNYNTKKLLRNCLNSLRKVRKELKFLTIVSDNGSTDGSVEMMSEEFKWVKIIKNEKNLGFAAGNNRGRHYAVGDYVLFLNSDTLVYKGTLKKSLDFIKKNKQIGALTCKILLPTGKLDIDTRRSFPTPWVAFSHMFFLDKFFPKSHLFSQYSYGYLPIDMAHEVDVIQGAFFLARRKVLEILNWFDEDYFLDGEDIDICWRMKEKGFKLYYFPATKILHFKGATKGKIKSSRFKVRYKDRLKFVKEGVSSMEVFYKKHFWDRYPFILNIIVVITIRFFKLTRLIKALITCR